MTNKHFLNCSAPICSCDTNPNYKKEVVWYPGESMCRQQPYQLFQKKQIEVNSRVSKGKFDMDKVFTAESLEKIHFRKMTKKR